MVKFVIEDKNIRRKILKDFTDMITAKVLRTLHPDFPNGSEEVAPALVLIVLLIPASSDLSILPSNENLPALYARLVTEYVVRL